MAVKSKVSAVKSALSILEIELPVPLALKEMPVKAPASEISQSLVSMAPVSPLSPKMNRPAVWKLPEIEALPSKKALPSTSRAPTIKRSLIVSISVEVAVATPKRE